MKTIYSFFFFFVCSLGPCFAQSSKEAIQQDPRKCAGSFYVYDSGSLPPMTPAPKGYNPFYISHFARHGARYCTSEYDALYDWLTKASDAGVLSDAGKKFFAQYEPFYQKVRFRKGNLTMVGQGQHRQIAEHMFTRFPAVFKGNTHVEAASTESPRVIMSMWSCLNKLDALDKDMSINAESSARFAPWLQPSLSSNPYLVKGAYRGGKKAEKELEDYLEQTVPWREIAGRFFTTPDAVKDVLKTTPMKFIDLLHSIVSCTYCLDEDQGYFDDVFTQEELQQVWKAVSAKYFLDVANYTGSESLILDYAGFTLGQIIEMADADMLSGRTQLRLRFGHDSGIAPLFILLDANGIGRAASTFEESLDIFPNYYLPMGANLQIIFYKKSGKDILLKVLINEREATLPIEPVEGCYYRWADFKAHYLPIIKASKAKIDSFRTPEAREAVKKTPRSREESMSAFREAEWNWHPVANTSVEAGSASVEVFGGVQNVSLIRFSMKEHTVSVHESDGPSAGTVSKLGESCQALAAINGGFFDKNHYPVSLVKDEGKVVSSKTRSSFNEGLFLIKNKKGSKVDIVTADSLAMAGKAKAWYEAMAAGPILIEDGVCLQLDDVRRKLSRRRHPRTVVGYTSDGYVYFVVVDGRFPLRADGMTLTELQILCEALGLYEAINLDGGGSATMWTADAGVINHPCDNKEYDHAGERVVPNILIVK